MSVGAISGKPQKGLKYTLQMNVLNFVFDSLSIWRDLPERRPKHAENDLNSQLSKFLTDRAITHGLPYFFHHEQPQEVQGITRSIDIAAIPASLTSAKLFGSVTDSTIVVIEAKRLPAPRKERQREYISGLEKISGGIQRFKLMKHGSEHSIAGIVGYIQKENSQFFFDEINSWVCDLCKKPSPDGLSWSEEEKLNRLIILPNKTARSISTHGRISASPITLHHLWVEMNLS